MRRLRLLKPYRARLLFAYGILLATTLFQLAYPQAIAYFVDRTVDGVDASWIAWMAAAMALVLLVHATAIGIGRYLFASTGSMVVADLRKSFFAAVVQQPVCFFDSENVGDLTSRLSVDIEHLQEALTIDAAMLVSTALTGIGGAIMLVWISPQLSLLMVLVAPLVVVGMRWIGARGRRLAEMKQEKLASCGRLAQEVFSNIRLVHAFTQERLEREKFANSTDAALGYSISGDRLFAGLEGGASFVQGTALLATVLVGGTLVAKQSLSIGELTGFILYATMAVGSATALGGMWGVWMRSIGATDRVFELLANVEEATARDYVNANSNSNANLGGEICFDAVGFSYPTRPESQALTDFSLTIQPGEKVALVGASGAGKSTVVNLLLGFYDSSEGRILFDGVEMSELNLADIRSQIAIVEQEPMLFATSILENIRYGAIAEVDDEQVVQAARDAFADDFIEDFPDGYDTLVGSRGAQLSGGQKQRVAIARALLRDPKVLILDEATSALDSESESKVQTALERVMQGRTTIIIAHRPSTIAFADRVITLRDGKIVRGDF